MKWGRNAGDEMQAGSTDTSKGEGEGKKSANEGCPGAGGTAPGAAWAAECSSKWVAKRLTGRADGCPPPCLQLQVRSGMPKMRAGCCPPSGSHAGGVAAENLGARPVVGHQDLQTPIGGRQQQCEHM